MTRVRLNIKTRLKRSLTAFDRTRLRLVLWFYSAAYMMRAYTRYTRVALTTRIFLRQFDRHVGTRTTTTTVQLRVGRPERERDNGRMIVSPAARRGHDVRGVKYTAAGSSEKI